MTSDDFRRIAGHKEGLDAGIVLLPGLTQFNAVHMRHDGVGEQQVNGVVVPSSQFQRGKWIGFNYHLVAELSENGRIFFDY